MRLENRRNWVGVDEAGRGPLAGPVVAAAVLVPDDLELEGIRDSKKMSAAERESCYQRIIENCPHSVASASVAEIDRLNILQATFLAMRRALEQLDAAYEGILVDGNQPIRNTHEPCEAIVKGDGRIASIAAASVIAKTHRDRLMKTLHQDFENYGFDRHFGYATPDHLTALKLHGPCEHHRKSFSPIKEMLLQPCLTLEK